MKFKKIYDDLRPVHIYGKVLDQDGNAVADADVKIDWESAALLIGQRDSGKSTWLRTNERGLWKFIIDKPHRAFVTEVKKPGYEYSTRYNQKSSVRNLTENVTAQDAPAVTVLRKKGETTFLIVRPGGNRLGEQLIRVLSPNSQTNSLDLIAGKGDVSSITGSHADLNVSVDYERTIGKWTVTYSATDGEGGIVIGNDLLYEAPKDGYQEKVVLHGPLWPKYLYLRSRTPAIYSRLDLEHVSWKESETVEGFRITFKAWINPYGERNLEYETDLRKEWRLDDRLEAEAKALLRQNSRPAKPDLPKLMNKAENGSDKDKEKP